MRRKWLLFLSLAVTTAAMAQPRLPKNYYWKKLDNGLEVVVIENRRVPLVTIEMAVKNGAYTEGPEYSGLSHLFEHMFFKANKDYPDQATFIKRTEELGMIWNGTTGTERVNYFFYVGQRQSGSRSEIYERRYAFSYLPNGRYGKRTSGGRW